MTVTGFVIISFFALTKPVPLLTISKSAAVKENLPFFEVDVKKVACKHIFGAGGGTFSTDSADWHRYAYKSELRIPSQPSCDEE